MHVAFGQFSSALQQDADIHVDLGSTRLPPAPEAPWQRSAYGEARRFSPTSIAVVAGVHAALFAALVTLDIVPVGKARSAPTVVNMVELSTVPPPITPPPPVEQQTQPEPLAPVQTPIVSPPPVVQTNAPPPPVVAAPQPAPQAPAPVAKASAPAAPAPILAQSGPVSVGDLSSKMVSAKPPKMPFESRKKKEQGSVVLRVLLDVGGSVSDLSIAKSSGFTRLDKAALEAVRKWRWSPTVRGGEAVMVTGSVKVDFILQG